MHAVKESLENIAALAGKSVDEIAATIITELEKDNIVDDDWDFYGKKIRDVIDNGTQICDLVSVLNNIGIKEPQLKDLNALLDIEFMGDGECPVCGADMRVIDGRYEQSGDGYTTPEETFPIWEEKECENCKHQHKFYY